MKNILNKQINKITKIQEVFDRLEDAESKKVFLERLELIEERDVDNFFKHIIDSKKEITCPELDEHERAMGAHRYIIFGCGKEGVKAFQIIEKSGREVLGFMDNNTDLQGTYIQGKYVFAPKDVLAFDEEVFIVITPRASLLEIYLQLLMMEFSRNNIIIPKNGFLLGVVGKQYFDLFEPQKSEVFVDAGGWHGDTILEFIRWCGNDYKKIYSFEPDEACWEIMEKNLRVHNVCNFELIKKGLWNQETELYFEGNGTAGSMCSQYQGFSSVKVTTIDKVLNGSRASFIKMDVEGSELETLQGARATIEKFHPRLAVCVYHKDDDIWKLPHYIWEIDNTYKIWMRHYTTHSYETVLYAK